MSTECHMTFRLSQKFRDKLKSAGDANNHAIGSEIRQRLLLTFYLDEEDPKWRIKAEIKRLQAELVE